MNKARINVLLPKAREEMKKEEYKLVKNNEISKTFRGYISSFGAAVINGSLPAAVAFFSEQGGAKEDRSKLIELIFAVIDKPQGDKSENLFEYIVNNSDKEDEIKEEIYNAAIAIKLAMSTFILKK